MTRMIISLVGILFMISLVCGVIQVNVYVDDTINGFTPFFNRSEFADGAIQNFQVVFENVGSVGCNTRLRADIYNSNNDLVYTAWSREFPLEPGGVADMNAYWHPRGVGNYTANLSIYYCNLILNGPVFNVSVPNRTTSIMEQNTTGDLLDITYETTMNYVEMRIKPKEDLEGIVIIPKEYPLGWMFSSTRVDSLKKDTEKIVKIDYNPTIWKESGVEFDILSTDGNLYLTKSVEIKEKKELPIEHIIIAVLSIVIIILLIVIFRLKGIRDIENDREQ